MVLEFSKISKKDVMTAGGKGANLGEMTAAGINVPQGFVVTADVYREFLAANGLEEILEKELLEAENDKLGSTEVGSGKSEIGETGENEAELFRAAGRIRNLIKSGKLPDDVRNEVEKAYSKLGEKARVAVRSSATAEDLPDASFAGQQETYLNIKGAEEVVKRIIDCYASLWGNRAVSYRAKQGYNQLSVAIAVVVQLMVESEKAGVLFTVNPVTENTEEMQINASFGLGESVVSGKVTADSYIVDKSGKTRSISIGSKETQIIYAEKDTKEVAVNKALREKPALSESEVLKLVKVGNVIEKHYGCPMDIEWAIKGEEVYILQARAITTLKGNNEEDEIKAYLKGGRISKMVREQMAFMLEKMPFAYRVLDYDYMTAINEQKAVIFDEAGININSNPQIDDDGIQTLPKGDKGINKRIFRLIKTIRMLKNYEYCRKVCMDFMKKYEEEVGNLKKLDFQSMSLDKCREFMAYSIDLTKRLCYDRFKYALFPSALNKDLEKAVKKVNPAGTVFDLYRNLDNKTAVVSRDIESLAAEVKKDERLKTAVIRGESFAKICNEFSHFHSLAENFLMKNGFKSDYNCYCVDAKTFIEDPDRLINVIKPLIIQENDVKEDADGFNKLKTDMENIYGSKFTKLGERIGCFRYFHKVREESQYLWETVFYYVRKCLVRANFLLLGDEDYKHGIANLFHKELLAAMDRGNLNEADKEKIRRRNEKYPFACKVWEASKLLVFDKDGEELKGVSGSPGVALGPACLIKGPEEFYKMKKGDILVCHFTDPEWTPLFSLAGAVVADTGSALSHAAIVAREYGIPAVLGVGFATTGFKDGDRIKVDGDKGIVSKLD